MWRAAELVDGLIEQVTATRSMPGVLQELIVQYLPPERHKLAQGSKRNKGFLLALSGPYILTEILPALSAYDEGLEAMRDSTQSVTAHLKAC